MLSFFFGISAVAQKTIDGKIIDLFSALFFFNELINKNNLNDKEDFSDVEWQWVKCAKCLKKRKVPGFVSANAYTWSCVNNIHDPRRLVYYLEKFLLRLMLILV